MVGEECSIRKDCRSAVSDSHTPLLPLGGLMKIVLTEDEYQECVEIAKRRQNCRNGYSRSNYYDDLYEENVVGVVGEMAFEKLTGLPMDRSVRPKGDGGIDFEIDGHTIDVKACRNPVFLLLKYKERNRCADILVSAKYDNERTIEFLGWQHRHTMFMMPKKRWWQDILAYYIPTDELHPMINLTEAIERLLSAARDTDARESKAVC
jgi:hypothetical protein